MAQQRKQDPDSDSDKANSKKDTADTYLKYSGMAIQMGIIILVGSLIGKKLDAYFQTERSYLTALFALLSIFAAFYLTL